MTLYKMLLNIDIQIQYDDINETSKNIPDLEFCGKDQTQTLDNIKVGVSCSGTSQVML